MESTILLGSIAVVCLGLAKGGFVGLGLTATPILMLTLPPLDAVAVLVPVMVAQDAFSVWAYRHDFDRRNLRIMLPGAVVGVAIAWIVASAVPYLRLVVAATLLWIVAMPVTWPPSGSRSTIAGFLWGTVSGFAGLIANAASVGFLAYVLPQKLPPVVYAGTMAMFFALVDVIKLSPLLAMQQFTLQNLRYSALLMPLGLVANALGVWLVHRIPKHLFYRIAYILVFCIALILIAQEITE